ncbi:TetR/AcrR family transcriptional regulator C-terminal domain-containing protein [Nonomuraea sp. NEAU-A123]|uniref:TetR/AcrR family transcriptional regulator C-terminal domain-containing protein n=1 Tax=Nonomuraea sp. NEAU-A123 TaxID=2839649 RepID=UPI001BE4725C|nr:TetR/AcrR family transcriptional regulator C-terminal domain-containing protein [Nonomuraea sp. NEAU-A123]MBT2233357.1 TetR/AcrR family transcriptional regulator C-terminal domain-containing protein [Nonomuraea sp. NEAU-A123]
MVEAAPPYVRIVDDIKRRIADGELRAGDRVPSTRQLARDWDVALATAAKALARLGQQGVVVAEPRVGTVVAGPPGRSPRHPHGDPDNPSRDASHSAAHGPAHDSVHDPARDPARDAVRESGRDRARDSGRDAARDLTRDRVVRIAVEMADAEGLPALSMRGVAGRLGVATMSLYRHVGSKDDLVELMIEQVFGEFPLPDEPPHGWRARLEVAARVQWAAYRRHPWMAGITSLTRPLPSPSLLRHTEWALAAIDGHGLDPVTMMDVHILLYSHVQGIAANFELEVQARAMTGLTDDEWMRDQDEQLAAIVTSGPYPTFVDVIARMGGDFEFDFDRLFELGLRALLDGLAGIIERQPGRD